MRISRLKSKERRKEKKRQVHVVVMASFASLFDRPIMAWTTQEKRRKGIQNRISGKKDEYWKYTPLVKAALRGVAEADDAGGVLLAHRDVAGNTPLHLSALVGNTSAAELLVQKNPGEDKEAMVMLFLSAGYDKPSGAELLIDVITSEYYGETDMASELIMMCQHDGKFAAIRMNRGHDFSTVIHKICARWSDLDPDSVILNYSLNDTEHIILDNDDDLTTMFQNAEHAGIDDIMITVRDGAKFFVDEAVQVTTTVKSDTSKGKQTMIVDDDDIIPSFCSHKKVKLLSFDWSDGITAVGQRFEGGASDFKNVLRKYAIERGLEYTLAKNDKVRVTAQCKYRTVKTCMWHVHARIMPGNEYFHILGMDLAHTCGFAVRTLTSPHATAELVADLVGDDVRGKHQTKPVDVVKGIKRGYGLNISYHQAWWGIEKARGLVFGDYVKSFSCLKWYVGAAKSTNPGSHIVLESDEETKRFKRLFVAFGACVQGFNQCRPLIFLDAAHLKGRFRGTIMAATGKNGNQGTTRAYRERVVSEFVRCAYAPTREIFHQNMTKLLSHGDGKVQEFLTNLHYENWSNAFFRGQRYGEMTSNVAESFNAWIEAERHLPITILVDELRKKIMNLMSERREEASKWGCQICLEMDKRMRASFNESRTWVVSAAGDGVYEVHSFPNVTVDIIRRICSCQKWQLIGFPCAHAVIVLSSSGKDMTEYIDPYYFSQTFRASYSNSIHPIPTVWMPERPVDEDFLLPPLCKKPPGRPKNKRIPSRGENVTFIRCGRCGKMGKHNRQTCKDAI
ncbi:hypothetical protein RHSIM_Rhsim05G0009100 [Rhododendron simsii]|uniref:SWIM-type domain-containing protein n=1 Tax=Rhododendron simsii TaxID=118357 RepID=A0A834GYJ2_RHOSS|nr:hypothetical protein RHSIM_Rhsim05G0009100 [Rhododendron simsii]